MDFGADYPCVALRKLMIGSSQIAGAPPLTEPQLCWRMKASAKASISGNQ